MSDKTHCDRCDRVIPPTEEYLCLEPILAIGYKRTIFPGSRRGFCYEPCVVNDHTLLDIWDEAHRDVEVEED